MYRYLPSARLLDVQINQTWCLTLQGISIGYLKEGVEIKAMEDDGFPTDFSAAAHALQTARHGHALSRRVVARRLVRQRHDAERLQRGAEADNGGRGHAAVDRGPRGGRQRGGDGG